MRKDVVQAQVQGYGLNLPMGRAIDDLIVTLLPLKGPARKGRTRTNHLTRDLRSAHYWVVVPLPSWQPPDGLRPP